MPGVACTITPISAFQSTNLNSKMNCYNRLAERIMRNLGYPLIRVELHQDQVYEAISQACELFTKYAGYTKEYMVFDSRLYEPNIGLRLDQLYTIHSNDLNTDQFKLDHHRGPFAQTGVYVTQPESVYIANSSIPVEYFTSSSTLSSLLTGGTFTNQIFTKSLYDTVISFNSALSSYFTESTPQGFASQCNDDTDVQIKYNAVFDYDVMDYRKVIAITDFDEGSSTGVNSLFTIEQTLAQQTYFSYAMGNYGFDLVSWYCVKEWLDMREKLLATRRSLEFDERTQMLRIYPQPSLTNPFFGVIACYVERPVRDIIKEQWVHQYSLALCKIMLGRVRGKFGGVNLLGGGALNYEDVLSEGKEEKERLETQLYEGAAPGAGSADPVIFIVG